jgi:hypothetical protein
MGSWVALPGPPVRPQMRGTTSIAVVLALVTGPALAGPCDSLGHAIATRTKATIEAITPEFGNVKFNHSAAHEMTLMCGPGAARSIFVAYEGKPDARFLALASVAGGILLGGASVSPRAVGDCMLAAMVDPSGVAEREAGLAHLDCSASVPPDENGNVTISHK